MMTGEETDKLFQRKNCKARVAYLNPPIELIQFVDEDVNKSDKVNTFQCFELLF